jgi:Asp-tRNA(Asn)/Glu-tRNA(Gln) amidotransferase A subunit family amidase
MTSAEAPWKDIARRKRAQRAAAIPRQWRLRNLPKEGPQYGSQPVLHIPLDGRILSPSELAITELYNAKTLVEGLSRATLTCFAVTTAFCKRAAIAQQVTNCLTEPLFTSALARAKELDNYLVSNGKPIGPLHGLPITVKDSFNITGIDSSLGLASLCFKPATSNSTLVDLLLSLGCVIIAKTNVPQTLASLDSNNNVFGRTMNPINRRMTAGGSSGGEGVMVAMKGCMVGWGTDVGGSIRVPAMCNGVYGFKPSNGRVPFGKQQDADTIAGMSRIGMQAVAGPLARSLDDIDFVMREVVPRAELWGEDCLPGKWSDRTAARGSGEDGEFVIGIMRGDGNCELLPPIRKVIDEVAETLRRTPGVQVVDVSTPPAWTKCQSLISKFFGISGGEAVADLLEETGEPLVPWMEGRFQRGKPRTLKEVASLQKSRTLLEREMLDVWNKRIDFDRVRKIDAMVCPVAAHPVPEIDRWNAVGYTSSFVLLDYPAGVVPVRDFNKNDLELGKEMDGKAIGSWDERNRELWDEKTVDRTVYLGTPLSVQVVTPRQQDERLAIAMRIIDEAVHQKKSTSKL